MSLKGSRQRICEIGKGCGRAVEVPNGSSRHAARGLAAYPVRAIALFQDATRLPEICGGTYPPDRTPAVAGRLVRCSGPPGAGLRLAGLLPGGW
jgi:hypothetical protein